MEHQSEQDLRDAALILRRLAHNTEDDDTRDRLKEARRDLLAAAEKRRIAENPPLIDRIELLLHKRLDLDDEVRKVLADTVPVLHLISEASPVVWQVLRHSRGRRYEVLFMSDVRDEVYSFAEGRRSTEELFIRQIETTPYGGFQASKELIGDDPMFSIYETGGGRVEMVTYKVGPGKFSQGHSIEISTDDLKGMPITMHSRYYKTRLDAYKAAKATVLQRLAFIIDSAPSTSGVDTARRLLEGVENLPLQRSTP